MKGEERGKATILVSTCLVGVNTRYDGGHNRTEDIVALVKAGKAVFLCPEQLGGLTTPREPSEIEPGKTAADVLAGNARVLATSGQDVTAQYVRGAQGVLAFCQEMGIETAILKAHSPSCGSQETYDGAFGGTLRPGRGITAELLVQNGIEVLNEIEYLTG